MGSQSSERRAHRVLITLVTALLLGVVACTVSEPSAEDWTSTSERSLESAASAVGTARLTLARHEAGDLWRSYAVVVLRDAEEAAGCGLGALLPRSGKRLGTWLNRRYEQIRVSHAARRAPAVVDLALVDRVESAVHLTAARESLLRPRVETQGAPQRPSLGRLIGLPVHLIGREGEAGRRPRVLDVRLDATPGETERCAVSALVVGSGRPGALLGYDRGYVSAPWPVAAVVRWLHRHSRHLDLGDGVAVDWENGVVRVAESVPLEPLVG